jgi:DNA-directed RNA polymerase specialized sigma24 family protein
MFENGFEPSFDSREELLNVMDGKVAMLLIARLPLKYQKIMRMRFTQNLTLSEISDITGQTKNSIAVQVHRGLEKLKAIYCSPDASISTLIKQIN